MSSVLILLEITMIEMFITINLLLLLKLLHYVSDDLIIIYKKASH